MRIVIFLTLIGIIGISSHYTEGHNGRPACQTTEELEKQYWRNNFDSTTYWACIKKNELAIQMNCKSEHLFYPAERVCVPFNEWKHIPLQDPPSLAIIKT